MLYCAILPLVGRFLSALERRHMAVKLRLKRMGSTHRPVYRLTAVDGRKKRDGRVIEELGQYNPREADPAKQANLKLDRCAYWLSVGAQPSETVAGLLHKAGLTPKSGTKAEAQPTATA